MINLTEKNKQQLKTKGISIEKVKAQIETFKEGIPFVNLVNSATVGNGIQHVEDAEKEELIKLFETKKDKLNILKFVPASGAATRMFKSLFNFLEKFNPEEDTFTLYSNREKDSDIKTFFIGLEKLPFFRELKSHLKEKYPDFDDKPDDEQRVLLVKEILLDEGLGYGNYPKGLLPFHRYKTHPATAFEEHLYEAALYDTVNDKATLHFTISEEHLDKFNKEFTDKKDYIKSKTGVDFEVDYSFQKESTDTIAVTPDNEPFLLENGDILFRPGGHGALIENLNDQDADIIFIKNIDNVVVYRSKVEMASYKKMLGGILLKLREKAFNFRALLDKQVKADDIQKIKDFLENELNVFITPDFKKYRDEYQIEYLIEKLDRPIRVCGMVKNEGEPGGGPFWIKDENGNISLQIIETAQIDKSNTRQKDILKTATHFNPVDIVCCTKNYKGEKFDLLKYVDHKQAFITQKTKDGQELKALELPGLWNGSMANWTTVFVEVPLVTFNPVKTVNDLLKPSHQVKLLPEGV
ncbi:DUF4301 family protein [Abyssalbus ytuae]|uniref:DUF4301 family protein n=1 Tax=Abyssalbus ytuae TaxID=2926907 RepID=A0A9E6ZPA4_9FLAO|nr:DUF4301 family protein [Abyssalbus ytuae]UOB16248.1 DUF4301 family protein [Abyssalbus ytuae]